MYRIPSSIKVKTREALQNGFRDERVRMRSNLAILPNDTSYPE